MQSAFTHRKEIGEIEQRRTASQVKSNDRHLKVISKEFARKWNVGLETARDNMNATTQRSVRISTETMYRRVIVDHLDLH